MPGRRVGNAVPSRRRNRRGLGLLLGGFALVLAAPAARLEARTLLVFKDGRRMEVQKYEVRGAVVYVTDLGGTSVVVKTDLIDFERSRQATEAASRPATPTPPPPKKKSIVEVAREEQERRRRSTTTEPAPGIPDRPSQPAPTAPPPTPGPTTAVAAPVAAETMSPPPSPVETPAAETPVPADETPVPVATPPPAAQPVGLSPLVLYGGAGLGVLVVGAGLFVALKRKPKPPPRRGAKPSPAAGGADEVLVAARAQGGDEDLLTPAFAREDSAEDLPVPLAVPDSELAPPAELGAADRKALGAGGAAAPEAEPAPRLRLPTPGILSEGQEVQIRIGADVYTCPDLGTLRRWVEEGRVIETSEVLSPDGTWLMAGSIPDLETAFDRRRETLGY